MNDVAREEASVSLVRELEALRREIERLRTLRSGASGLLETILERSPHAIIVSDAKARLVLQNRACERIWAGSASAQGIDDWSQYRAFHPDGTAYRGEDWAMAKCLRTGEITDLEEIRIQRFDGTAALILGSAAPILGPNGEIEGALAVFADITRFKELESAERQARQAAETERARAAFLVEAGDLLSASLDVSSTLERIAALAVPRISDWCVVEVVGTGGELQQVAMMHKDPRKGELAREIRKKFPPEPGLEVGSAAVVRTGAAALYAEIGDEDLRARARDEEHLRMLRELGLSSAMVVPMTSRGRTHGAITFVSDAGGKRFDADDLSMAEQLAQRAALAIDNARLYQAEREARAAAERATERLGRIQIVTTQLAVALTTERVAEIVIDHGVAAIGASRGALWMLEPGGANLVMLRSSGFPDAAIARYSVIPVDAEVPITDAIRRRAAVFLESRADYAARYAASESGTRDLAVQPPVQGIACLPLLGGHQVLGGLACMFVDEKSFDEEEKRFLILLVDHCSLALQRAALYEAERRVRAEKELLYALVEATGRAGELEQIHDAALDALSSTLDSDRNAILLADDEGKMRFAAWRKLTVRHLSSVEGHAVWPADVKDPQPILVPDTDADPSFDSWRALLEAERIRAMAFVPLVDRGALVGKLMAYFSEPRRFSSEELRLLRTIASHVAEALGRKRAEAEIARLYEQAQTARAVAEQEAISREHLLALVAHDLRNLLHAAQMRTSMLLRRLPTIGSPQALGDDLETIHRSTEGMSRLIDDLLDAAAIDAGRLSIRPRACEVESLFNDALETARVLAAESEIDVCAEGEVDGLQISCDRERVLQVLANLVGNAVKFSPRGGSIQLEARRSEAELWFVVRDRGPGIAAEQIARVFERYFKGAGGRPGVGLGLYICKGLVEAHRGRIWVESKLCAGTNVFVALPIASP